MRCSDARCFVVYENLQITTSDKLKYMVKVDSSSTSTYVIIIFTTELMRLGNSLLLTFTSLHLPSSFSDPLIIHDDDDDDDAMIDLTKVAIPRATLILKM